MREKHWLTVSCTPYQESNWQPRHVFWPELSQQLSGATFWCPTNWATPARAGLFFKDHCNWTFFLIASFTICIVYGGSFTISLLFLFQSVKIFKTYCTGKVFYCQIVMWYQRVYFSSIKKNSKYRDTVPWTKDYFSIINLHL